MKKGKEKREVCWKGEERGNDKIIKNNRENRKKERKEVERKRGK